MVDLRTRRTIWISESVKQRLVPKRVLNRIGSPCSGNSVGVIRLSAAGKRCLQFLYLIKDVADRVGLPSGVRFHPDVQLTVALQDWREYRLQISITCA